MNNKWILYQTTNLVNGKVYVGVHKLSNTKRSKNYLGSGQVLLPALKKYGRNNFTRTTLAEFNCAEDAFSAEAQMVTKEFCDRDDTYNIKTGGIGWTGNGIGLTYTKESKAKMSAAQKGKILSEETKVKISDFQKGRVRSKETRSKMSSAKKGKTGAKNSKSLPIIIDSKYYESAEIASKFLSLSSSTVKYRVKSTTPTFANYRFASEKEKAEYKPVNCLSA